MKISDFLREKFFKRIDWKQKYKEDIESLKQQIGSLSVELERVQGAITSISPVVNQMTERVENYRGAFTECEFAIDWKEFNIVSIERIVTDGREKTMFGYIRNGEIKSGWHFFCSRRRHDELVAEFRKYMKTKYKEDRDESMQTMPNSETSQAS